MGRDQLISALRQMAEPLPRLTGLKGVYLVGGYLRDLYWGLESADLDLAVPVPLEPILAEIATRFGQEPFILNQRFQSYRASTANGSIDLTPLHPDGLEADLRRRDYTVNTLAVATDRLGPALMETDVVGHPLAFTDLDARLLRMVHPNNFTDDPARILRGYRLAANHRLTPDTETRSAWQAQANLITAAAAERLHEELLRWFATDNSLTESVKWAAKDRVLFKLFPCLASTLGCSQNAYHHLDVWEHTLAAIAEMDQIRRHVPTELQHWQTELTKAWQKPVSSLASAGALARLAMLLHDTGKPNTRAKQDDGHITFYQHQDVGATLIAPLLEKFKFASSETDFILRLIREHLRLGFYSDYQPTPPKLVYRFIRRLGDSTPLMVIHALADCAATKGPLNAGSWDKHVQTAAEILNHFFAETEVAVPPVLLDGHEIMRLLNLKPGPIIGHLKDVLLEATAAGEVETKTQAQQYVRETYEREHA